VRSWDPLYLALEIGSSAYKMAPASLNYQRDERVLCFHGEILYEGKIIDLRHIDPEDRKSPYEYLVHYKGWKNTYVSISLLCPAASRLRWSAPLLQITWTDLLRLLILWFEHILLFTVLKIVSFWLLCYVQ
jgi:hypothetical protein